jgi:membrane-associated phospholipid phosphatase
MYHRIVWKKCLLSMLVVCWLPQASSAQAWGMDSTGTLVKEGYRFRAANMALPAALITMGAVGTAVKGWNDVGLFARDGRVRTGYGKRWADRTASYAEYASFGWVFACDFMGKEQHHWKDQVMVTLLSEMFNGVMVTGLKYGLNVRRPRGSGLSFPSGHTANAFLGAHIAFKEMKDNNPWLAHIGYVMAMTVGVSRVYDNWHWIADTVAGAGIAILSVELAYLIYFPRYEVSTSSTVLLLPSFHQGHPTLGIACSF